jgi:hypothetical protein
MRPPRTVLRRVRLKPQHRPRGKVHFFVEGEQIPPPAVLEIVQAPGNAVHILYVDRAEAELTESWHPTIDAALYHAKWEYGLDPEEWEDLAPGARGA